MSQMRKKLAAEIAARGPLPFARFMEQALYCPVYGYYEAEADKIGRGGDYYTSSSVGRAWGEMLAAEYSRWTAAWEAVGAEGAGAETRWHWAEAGAHRGDTARDILDWTRLHRPGLYSRLRFWLIEPSARRRRWQRETLRQHAPVVRWCSTVAGAAREAEGGMRGIIFSNELLDAMPVERLGWDAAAGQWFEWGVALDGENFRWTRMSMPHEQAPRVPPELLRVLPDAFTLERSPAAQRWWREAACALGFGRLVTFDYGLTQEELLAPERAGGTLRGYRAHQVSSDVLANPGEQDITAHVNFSAIQSEGEAAGLRTVMFKTQAEFLESIAARLIESGECKGPDAWPDRWTRAFKTLTHPEHLGRAFRVLVQERTATRAPGASALTGPVRD